MLKSVVRVVRIALLTALIIAGVFIFFFFAADAPALSDNFTVVFENGPTAKIESADFAGQFNAALESADLSIFQTGEKVAVIMGEKDSYAIYTTEGGLCVATGPWNVRNFHLDEESTGSLAAHEGLAPLYREMSPRPLILEIGERLLHVPPMGGEWAHIGLDGLMRPYDFGEMCPQSVMVEGGGAVEFDFEDASSAPYLIFGDGFEELNGDATSGTWQIAPGQIATLSAEPTYDTPLYHGKLSFVLTLDASVASGEQLEAQDMPDDVPGVLEIAEPTPAAQPTQKGMGELVFSVSSTSTNPGEMLTLKVEGAKADEVSCTTTLRATPRFFDSDEGAVALIPVRLSLEPGSYRVSLSAKGETESWSIAVEPKEFVVQHLKVDETTARETILSAQANREYNEKIEPLKAIYDADIYWSGSFILPVSGRITTEFGTMRYTNDDPTPSYHAAIDIGAARGAEVKATHAGRVLFSEYIDLTGNTILIEHGIGLKSWYYHMDSLSVKSGDMVEQGQVIGTVGSTGFSTGPHLHFGMSVGEYYVNPWSFID